MGNPLQTTRKSFKRRRLTSGLLIFLAAQATPEISTRGGAPQALIETASCFLPQLREILPEKEPAVSQVVNLLGHTSDAAPSEETWASLGLEDRPRGRAVVGFRAMAGRRYTPKTSLDREPR